MHPNVIVICYWSKLTRHCIYNHLGPLRIGCLQNILEDVIISFMTQLYYINPNLKQSIKSFSSSPPEKKTQYMLDNLKYARNLKKLHQFPIILPSRGSHTLWQSELRDTEIKHYHTVITIHFVDSFTSNGIDRYLYDLRLDIIS